MLQVPLISLFLFGKIRFAKSNETDVNIQGLLDGGTSSLYCVFSVVVPGSTSGTYSGSGSNSLSVSSSSVQEVMTTPGTLRTQTSFTDIETNYPATNVYGMYVLYFILY